MVEECLGSAGCSATLGNPDGRQGAVPAVSRFTSLPLPSCGKIYCLTVSSLYFFANAENLSKVCGWMLSPG